MNMKINPAWFLFFYIFIYFDVSIPRSSACMCVLRWSNETAQAQHAWDIYLKQNAHCDITGASVNIARQSKTAHCLNCSAAAGFQEDNKQHIFPKLKNISPISTFSLFW